jgi:hypothetical protein
MLSQISFHAAIIDVPPDKINEMQKLINTFVTGTFKFDKNRICLSPASGGLGMININNFIVSLHCSWVKRAHTEVTDNWRKNIMDLAGGISTLLDPRSFVPDLDPGPDPVPQLIIGPDRLQLKNPMLNTVAKSFWKFKTAFFTLGRNFFVSPLLGNPRIINNRREKTCVDLNTKLNFLSDPEKETMKRIKISDFTIDGTNFVTLNEFSVSKNIALDMNTFEQIKLYIRESWLLIKKFSNTEIETDLGTFLSRFKRGSKPFRKTLDTVDVLMIENKANRRNNTFFDLLNMQKPDNKILKILNGQWALSYYPVSLREFIFKFRNNILGLNTRVSHFNNNVGRGCTFCAKAGSPNVPDENFLHLFFNCTHTKLVIDGLFTRYLDHDLRDIEGQKKILFTGMGPDFNEPNIFLLTIMSIALHFIWQCKLQKKLPTLEGMLNDIFFIAESILKTSNVVLNAMNLNLPLCRDWAAESGRRRF